MNIHGYGLTDTGQKRDNNEDNLFFHDGDPVSLYAVADGMGGHAGGEVASQLAVQTVEASLDALSCLTDNALISRLTQVIQDADAAVQKTVQEDLSRYGMGTTLTLAAIRDHTLHVAHIGDSRLYRLRNGELTQLTVDHTEIQKYVEAGQLTAEQASESPYRHRLSQAVGLGMDLDIFTLTEPIQENDRFLLCSDGLHDMISTSEITNILNTETKLEIICQNLIDAANTAGGQDNISVVVIGLKE